MNIIELAKEAGFEVDEGLFPFEATEDKFIGTERVLERFATIIQAEELEAIYEEFYTSIMADLEHGIKRSNERAADKFKKEYPKLYKFWEWLNVRIGEYEGDEE